MNLFIYRAFRETLVLLLFAWGFPLLVSASENCELKAPPREAAINANHGLFLFIYPKTVNSLYSGCQTMWDEKGHKLFVIKFKKGSLIKYESYDLSGFSKKQVCQFKDGKPLQHNSKGCPDYDDVSDGFRTLSNSDEPIIPTGRDPRK